jgi:hypothetical protein
VTLGGFRRSHFKKARYGRCLTNKLLGDVVWITEAREREFAEPCRVDGHSFGELLDKAIARVERSKRPRLKMSRRILRKN